MVGNAYINASLLGVLSGMRSLAAPAFATHYAAQHRATQLTAAPFPSIGPERFARFLKTMAAGEMVADKLPFIPARIAFAPLSARMVSGALCGALICRMKRKPTAAGAILGGASALGSAFASYHLRQFTTQNAKLPNALVGLLEDTIVMAGGLLFLNSRPDPKPSKSGQDQSS